PTITHRQPTAVSVARNCAASRVLPTPPGPVTSRSTPAPSCSHHAVSAANSAVRPRKSTTPRCGSSNPAGPEPATPARANRPKDARSSRAARRLRSPSSTDGANPPVTAPTPPPRPLGAGVSSTPPRRGPPPRPAPPPTAPPSPPRAPPHPAVWPPSAGSLTGPPHPSDEPDPRRMPDSRPANSTFRDCRTLL